MIHLLLSIVVSHTQEPCGLGVFCYGFLYYQWPCLSILFKMLNLVLQISEFFLIRIFWWKVLKILPHLLSKMRNTWSECKFYYIFLHNWKLQRLQLSKSTAVSSHNSTKYKISWFQYCNRLQSAINDEGLSFTPQCKLDLEEYQKQLGNFFNNGTGTFWARKSM